MRTLDVRIPVAAFVLLAGCSDSTSTDTAPATGPTSGGETTATGTTSPTTATFEGYGFESRFEPGVSSVVHTGQTARQVLIKDMKAHLGGITARIDNGLFFPVPGDVIAELDFYFSFDGASSGQVPLLLSTDPPTEQSTYGDISTSANLVGKIAGNDAVGQHKDWSTEMVGWTADGVTSPESLVRHWFQQIDDAAVARMSGDIPLDPTGSPLTAVYLTPEGQDLQQLLEKFLHGSLALSQAADDYLDDDEADKGLNADHTQASEDAPYTPLEHAWDEGFAYFGAAHFYGEMSDEDVADIGLIDADASGTIDLGREYCFGLSVNAAKRDLGAPVATNFSQEAWDGFYLGRALLAQADTALTDDEMAQLKAYRDQALWAWEATIAATVVHYINDTLQDMDAFGTGEYSFEDHAKHWSEMKGFALALQFNPHSPVSDEDFASMHRLMGQQPILSDADPMSISAYRTDLIAARQILGDAYGFDPANLGDSGGLHGW